MAWFDSDKPLRSGWAWGQNYLEGAVAIAEANVGRGHLYLFGPEITFRAQPHGTFKFLFNGLYGGGEKSGIVPENPLRLHAADCLIDCLHRRARAFARLRNELFRLL